MIATLKNGLEVIIKDAVVDDALKVLEYMKTVNQETKNLTREPDEFQMTLEEETAFLKRAIESDHEAVVCAWDQDKLISVCGIHGSSLKRLKHRVNLGISILKDYHDLGLGTILMNVLIERAKELGKLKIELDVRSDNLGAIEVYKKTGFEVEGVRKNGFYVDGKYVDLLLMGKFL